jgi:hypothetical protein
MIFVIKPILRQIQFQNRRNHRKSLDRFKASCMNTLAVEDGDVFRIEAGFNPLSGKMSLCFIV